jgi:alpha-N-acetylglucosaminidase
MGGNLGLVGSLQGANVGAAAALASSRGACQGIGIDPEGINTNPAYFEFVLESAWRRDAVEDTREWLAAHGVRRCGREDARVRRAYALLHDTAYRANQTNFEHHLAYCSVALPMATTTWDKSLVRPAFDAAPLAEAWSLLLAAAPQCPSAGIRYDLVDVGREFISLFPCVRAYDAILAATTQSALADAAAAMTQTLTDLDTLLATHVGFMTGPWIADARALATSSGGSAADAAQLEMNARMQITTWLPVGVQVNQWHALSDYANKQWSGVTIDYYAARYAAFVTLADEAILMGGTPHDVDPHAFQSDIDYCANTWIGDTTTVYPVAPVGDLIAVSQQMYNTYGAPALRQQR